MASASAGAFLFFIGFKMFGVLNLRAPDRSSRCDEYTDEERERLTTRR